MNVSHPLDFSFLNYIAHDDLRKSLVSDYREMEQAAKTESWKSVQVLAGSIVEALLIDYLLSVKYQGKSEDAILKMQLGDTITACTNEKLLDSTTEKLCCVIQDYRNLIHPARGKRLQKPVKKEMAEIAMRLVRMVAEESGNRRREKFGYTALEVVAKIHGDSTVFPILLPTLLKRLPESEQRQLLFTLLPERNNEWRSRWHEDTENDSGFNYSQAIRCLSLCFRHLLKQATPDIQKEIADQYLRILHSAPEFERRNYELSFFRASDMEFVAPADRETIINHLFTSILAKPTREDISCAEGVGQFLTRGEGLLKQIRSLVHIAIHSRSLEVSEAFDFAQGIHKQLDPQIAKYFSDMIGGYDTPYSRERSQQTSDRIDRIMIAVGLKEDDDPIPF